MGVVKVTLHTASHSEWGDKQGREKDRGIVRVLEGEGQ